MPVSEITHKSATICYWSGTGNSYRVATWMGTIAENRGLETRILSLAEARSKDLLNAQQEGFISLVFPTHGFTAPWHVVKFAWNLPQTNLAQVYCVATRAGLKLGSVFIPGISGSATFVIALILLLKGYKVHGTMSVDMPSNWYSLHPIQSQKSHAAIIERARHKVAGLMEKTLADSKVWLTANNLYEIILGTVLSLVSVGYLLFGKFFLAKLFFASGRCNGCGLCEKHCTVKAITMRGKDKQRPYWKYNCESCMKCAALCPHDAVEAGHSWGVILYFITALPVSTYLFSLLGTDPKNSAMVDAYWLGSLLNIIYFYPAVFISYFVFSLLIRIPFLNYLFTRTTLTHFPFWGRYREPDTKLKDIT